MPRGLRGKFSRVSAIQRHRQHAKNKKVGYTMNTIERLKERIANIENAENEINMNMSDISFLINEKLDIFNAKVAQSDKTTAALYRKAARKCERLYNIINDVKGTE